MAHFFAPVVATTGNRWQLESTVQRELNLIGGVTLPMVMHSAAEMRLVNSKTDAAYLSLRRCGFDQQVIAEHMPMDAGHLSRMIRGVRPWSDNWQARFERLTGSYALTQWDCKARGAEFYADPVETRKAALRAELESLEKAA